MPRRNSEPALEVNAVVCPMCNGDGVAYPTTTETFTSPSGYSVAASTTSAIKCPVCKGVGMTWDIRPQLR